MIPLTDKQLQEVLEEAERTGRKVEFLLSKLVCTKKPGKKGGRGYRIRNQREGGTLDVKTVFLNADMVLECFGD